MLIDLLRHLRLGPSRLCQQEEGRRTMCTAGPSPDAMIHWVVIVPWGAALPRKGAVPHVVWAGVWSSRRSAELECAKLRDFRVRAVHVVLPVGIAPMLL